MKRLAFPIALILFGAFAATLFWKSGFDRQDSTEQVTPLPIILTKIQSLGELHTVSYSYNNVFDYQTNRQPHLWVDSIPGAGSLVRSSTRNTGLYSATGSVEAGLDLTQVKAAYETIDDQVVLVIDLPDAKVYRPHVDVKLHSSRPGVFWDDRAQALKATRHVENAFARTSRQQGIEQRAIENAREVIANLLEPIVDVPIEFREIQESVTL